MAIGVKSYDYIVSKIQSIKEAYPSLRSKTDAYAFSALCVKANFYKSPALVLSDSDFDEIIVDSQYDGGVDVLLSDPNSVGDDLVIGQSKLYKTITYDDVLQAMLKMVSFYKDMCTKHYETVNVNVQRRFLSLNAEIGNESKIHFVFYTSAPQKRIDRGRIEKKVREQFTDSDTIEVSILFSSDIEEEIKESEARKPTVERGKILIDKTGNVLWYGEDAAIVNVSACSIKQLYALHNINLLSRNLRYHIKGKVAGMDIDKGIRDTIRNNPASFWLKNNGITIVCDDFEVDGKVVRLLNFSIVNGAQTTYLFHKSTDINDTSDLYLPCKIIKTAGESEDEKTAFSLEIAQAANSQKAIKSEDLRANSPEQVRFAQAMREAGIFYKAKRGETIPKQYREPYLNTDLCKVGKLCLAAVFQEPCESRKNPSKSYNNNKYYMPIFNGNQTQIAKICRELLYIDHYFDAKFRRNFDRDNENEPNSTDLISFAHNARRICVAFVALAGRYYQGNLTAQDLNVIFSTPKSDSAADSAYKILRNLGTLQSLLSDKLIPNTDSYDQVLDKLFRAIIEAGFAFYIALRTNDQNKNDQNTNDQLLTPMNFLKRKDDIYYNILKAHWMTLSKEIKSALL